MPLYMKPCKIESSKKGMKIRFDGYMATGRGIISLDQKVPNVDVRRDIVKKSYEEEKALKKRWDKIFGGVSEWN